VLTQSSANPPPGTHQRHRVRGEPSQADQDARRQLDVRRRGEEAAGSGRRPSRHRPGAPPTGAQRPAHRTVAARNAGELDDEVMRAKLEHLDTEEAALDFDRGGPDRGRTTPPLPDQSRAEPKSRLRSPLDAQRLGLCGRPGRGAGPGCAGRGSGTGRAAAAPPLGLQPGQFDAQAEMRPWRRRGGADVRRRMSNTSGRGNTAGSRFTPVSET